MHYICRPRRFRPRCAGIVAYQTNDLFTAITSEGIPVSVVRVDGGMTAMTLMQFLADIIDLPVDRRLYAKPRRCGDARVVAQ